MKDKINTFEELEIFITDFNVKNNHIFKNNRYNSHIRTRKLRHNKTDTVYIDIDVYDMTDEYYEMYFPTGFKYSDKLEIHLKQIIKFFLSEDLFKIIKYRQFNF